MPNKNYTKNENTFSYLMYLLFQNGKFSELHIPSLNYFFEKENNILIKKLVPLEFEKRINELAKLFNNSKLTNLQLNKMEKKGKKLILELSSKKGELLSERNLSNKEKEELIDLFFEYHNEIDKPEIKLSNKYLDYFNRKSIIRNINEIKDIIDKKEKTKFDLIVFDYLENFLIQNLPKVDYALFRNRNVHGDFSQRNIVSTKEGLRIIDLEMAHKGYLELEFMKLLEAIFKFGSKNYFSYLKKYFLRNEINESLFRIYLRHEMIDLSVIKAAYFSTPQKYLELQEYILNKINTNKTLIKNFDNHCKKFNSLN